MSESTHSGRALRLVNLILLALCLSATALLLYSSWCIFIHGFPGEDYCRYYNMLWNTAHGRWFHYMVNDNYLLTHLSFTLVLLSPLVRFVGHPFSLSVVQLLCMVGGAVIAAVTARRQGLPAHYYLALVLFYLAYHLTQSVQMDEFHGAALYMLLMPWLYYSLRYSRRSFWIPFILTLFLREEAGFLMIPLILYFTVRDQWKAGRWYAGTALVYAAAATAFLYGFLIKHQLKIHNLDSIAPEFIWQNLGPEQLLYRLQAWSWVLLPVLPFLVRGAVPMAVIPSVAVITNLFSGKSCQFGLLYHYPAVVMATVIVAMIEAARLQEGASGRLRAGLRAGIPVYLFILTAASYFMKGVLPGSASHAEEYLNVNKAGLHGLWVARHVVPAENVLYAPHDWACFAAGRRDLLTLESYRPPSRKVDVVFCRLEELNEREMISWVKSGEFGVRFFDGKDLVVLQRGSDTSRNAEFLKALATPCIAFAETRALGGEKAEAQGLRRNDFVPGTGVVRYWCGNGHRAFINLSFDSSVRLDPGRYRAVFHFKANPPRRVFRRTWGIFSIHKCREQSAIVEKDIEPGSAEFRTQTLGFELAEPTDIEPRVTGGDAELWLDRVVFEQDRPEP